MVDYVGTSKLEELFMSIQNRHNIQYYIRKEIYRITKLFIDEQSNQELYIIMKHTFQYYALHQPNNILKQINDLNQKAIELCVKSILRNLQDFIHNKKNEKKPRKIMERPKQTTKANTIVLTKNLMRYY